MPVVLNSSLMVVATAEAEAMLLLPLLQEEAEQRIRDSNRNNVKSRPPALARRPCSCVVWSGGRAGA